MTMKRQKNAWLCSISFAAAVGTTAIAADKAGTVTSHSQGLHGYIGFALMVVRDTIGGAN